MQTFIAVFILDIAQKDAFTQVQPRHRHVGLQCHMKEKSTLTKMIKSVKKVSTDPERLRKRNGFQIEKYLFFEFFSPNIVPPRDPRTACNYFFFENPRKAQKLH